MSITKSIPVVAGGVIVALVMVTGSAAPAAAQSRQQIVKECRALHPRPKEARDAYRKCLVDKGWAKTSPKVKSKAKDQTKAKDQKSKDQKK
jgi:hypothetical protein